MTSCSEICGSEYAEQAQASGNCQQYGVRSYLHQVQCRHTHAHTHTHTHTHAHTHIHTHTHTHVYTQEREMSMEPPFNKYAFTNASSRQSLIPCMFETLISCRFSMFGMSLPSSFTRSARLLSGNVMKIFRFRDRLAGGALYSGR